jgi:hypothetical protein
MKEWAFGEEQGKDVGGGHPMCFLLLVTVMMSKFEVAGFYENISTSSGH